MIRKSIFSISFAVALVFMLLSCEDEDSGVPANEIPMGELKFLEGYDIDVLEPSGLSFGPDKTTLLTVSDNTNKVYELDLQGNVIRTLAYEGSDLEGVTYNEYDNTIAVVEERNLKVIIIDYDTGIKQGEYDIEIENSSSNKGLEGISFNTNNSIYYIVNEDVPKKLVLWNPASNIIDEFNMNFASDYSGVFVDAENSHLWFLSDESRKLYLCDYSANVQMQFGLDNLKYEGIIIDDSLAYIVNDATAKLNIYQIIK